MFLLLFDVAVSPANADGPCGRALGSRLDLLQSEGSVAGAVLRPTLVRGFGVGLLEMRPASCPVRVARGTKALFSAGPPRVEQCRAPNSALAGAWRYLAKATLPAAPASAGALMSGGLSVFTCFCPWETSELVGQGRGRFV